MYLVLLTSNRPKRKSTSHHKAVKGKTEEERDQKAGDRTVTDRSVLEVPSHLAQRTTTSNRRKPQTLPLIQSLLLLLLQDRLHHHHHHHHQKSILQHRPPQTAPISLHLIKINVWSIHHREQFNHNNHHLNNNKSHRLLLHLKHRR